MEVPRNFARGMNNLTEQNDNYNMNSVIGSRVQLSLIRHVTKLETIKR